MKTFLAYRSYEAQDGIQSQLSEVPLPTSQDLQAGEVLVRVRWSGINYKDALAATGAGKIMKRFPLTVGIDFAGLVKASADPRYQPGDPVLVVGCGLGEEHDGGFAEYARVRADWIVPLPHKLSLREAMAIGTAGFTAAMAIHRMEANGQDPHHGPIAVTGASGGVGSLAISMLAARGYQITAITGKAETRPYLERLGATQVLLGSEIKLPPRPLERSLWAGAIDNLGGDTLAWLCSTTQPLGNIASIGLASSAQLNTTVMPFILRGVNLLGINSTYCPKPLRDKVWQRLASDLRPRGLEELIVQREVGLRELPGVFSGYLERQVHGRTLVRMNGS